MSLVMLWVAVRQGGHVIAIICTRLKRRREMKRGTNYWRWIMKWVNATGRYYLRFDKRTKKNYVSLNPTTTKKQTKGKKRQAFQESAEKNKKCTTVVPDIMMNDCEGEKAHQVCRFGKCMYALLLSTTNEVVLCC